MWVVMVPGDECIADIDVRAKQVNGFYVPNTSLGRC